MEYVNDAQGKTVAVASPTLAPSLKSASVGGNAQAADGATVVPASGAAITVTGTSTLEQMKDAYQREVARVEADVASIKSFASTILTSSEADVVAVKTMPKMVKVAIAALIVAMYAAGFITAKFL